MFSRLLKRMIISGMEGLNLVNPMELTGKHILITGASSGIGRATAILADALGAKLTLVARSEKKLTETLKCLKSKNDHKMYAQDLSEVNNIEGLLKKISEECGKVDGFVHCAGIAPIRPLAMNKMSFVDEVMKINFFAFVECVRSLSLKKFSNDNASFVGISSVAASKGAKTQNAYAASKAAIEGFIRPTAKEIVNRRLRINAVEFGMINTDLYKYFKESGGNENALSDQYLGVGEVQDAANVIVFLLSDAAKFITGSVLIADGGFLS